MKIIITIAVITAQLLLVNCVFAQSQNTLSDKQNVENQKSTVMEPSAVVSYRTPRTISPMILKVNELTNGDDVLTEKVVAEIYKQKNISIKDVISDEDFSKMSVGEQAICISESEVIQIINRLKQ
ncbi:MAG: hypothetical protein JXR36_01970 [Bacteroidales bacterium]|nr:hypothetical protein [Bacteroidales bacterium]